MPNVLVAQELQRERDDCLELAARNYWLLENEWEAYYADKPGKAPPRSSKFSLQLIATGTTS